MALRDVIVALDRLGFTDVVLPFVLVFAVVFAVLQKTKVLGVYSHNRPKANLNAIVAFVLALSVVVLVRTLGVVVWLSRIVAFLAIVFFLVAVLLAFAGVHSRLISIIVFVVVIVIAFGFLQALVIAGVLGQYVVARVLVPVLAIIALVGAVWFLLHRQGVPGQPAVPGRRAVPQRSAASVPRHGRAVSGEDLPEGGEVEL